MKSPSNCSADEAAVKEQALDPDVIVLSAAAHDMTAGDIEAYKSNLHELVRKFRFEWGWDKRVIFILSTPPVSEKQDEAGGYGHYKYVQTLPKTVLYNQAAASVMVSVPVFEQSTPNTDPRCSGILGDPSHRSFRPRCWKTRGIIRRPALCWKRQNRIRRPSVHEFVRSSAARNMPCSMTVPRGGTSSPRATPFAAPRYSREELLTCERPGTGGFGHTQQGSQATFCGTD